MDSGQHWTSKRTYAHKRTGIHVFPHKKLLVPLYLIVALTIDRESSRDRAPICLVRCICKNDHVKGKHAYVKFKLSNIHAFVPVWMAPIMFKNSCLIAAQSLLVSPLGQLDYRRHIDHPTRTETSNSYIETRLLTMSWWSQLMNL